MGYVHKFSQSRVCLWVIFLGNFCKCGYSFFTKSSGVSMTLNSDIFSRLLACMIFSYSDRVNTKYKEILVRRLDAIMPMSIHRYFQLYVLNTNYSLLVPLTHFHLFVPKYLFLKPNTILFIFRKSRNEKYCKMSAFDYRL